MKLTWPTIRQWGGNTLLFLFILVVMLDPTNTILGVKDKVFILLVAYCMVFYKPSLRFLPHLLFVFVSVACSFCLGHMQSGGAVDMEEVLSICKAFSPLILLLWVHHFNFVKVSIVPAMLTALVVLVIYCCCAYDEKLEGAIYLYMKMHDYTVRMTHRYILGFRVFGIYYKSLVALCFPLFFLLDKLYNEPRHRILRFLPAALVSFAFLVCGTRATMMLPFFLFALVSYRSLERLKQWRYVLYPLLGLFVVMFVALIMIMAAEKTEASNVIKYGHLVSYKHLFEHNPLYMLIGQGIGTRFYSQGFHRLTLTTEWTYLELLRQYGLIFSIPLLFTLLYPMYGFWKRRKDIFCFGALGTYLAYFLIAGTNPLLVSSTGIIVVLCAYSLLCCVERKEVAKDEKSSANGTA